MDTARLGNIETVSIIQTLKPKNKDWIELAVPPQMRHESIAITCWAHPELRFCAISAIEKAMDKDGIDRGPEYHLSFSKDNNGIKVRCDSNEVKWLLDQFGLEGAEEDNHVPHGIARNFWRTVREDMIGLECGCKETEPIMKENKGDYIWRPA